jgi:hypothetical protein
MKKVSTKTVKHEGLTHFFTTNIALVGVLVIVSLLFAFLMFDRIQALETRVSSIENYLNGKLQEENN